VRHLTTNIGHASSQPTGCATPPTQQAGVTLVELLTVMVIVVILMAIGVPSFRYVTTANRMANEMNSLVLDLQYARSEAVREGQYVTVCIAGSTGSSPACAGLATTTWQKGWIIFSDLSNNQTITGSDPVLRIQNPFSTAFASSDTFTSTNSVSAITFNRNGFAYLGASGVTITLHDPTNNSVYTRCLYLTQAGMLTTQTHSTDASCS
jgi:type IV fimbrial biogenesis protein FimT